MMKFKLLKEGFSSFLTNDEIKKINEWVKYHLPSYASYAELEEGEKLNNNIIKAYIRYSIPNSEDDYKTILFNISPEGKIDAIEDESLNESIIKGNFGFINKKISQNDLLNELNKSENIIGDKESRYVAVAMKDSIARHSYEKVLFTNDLEEAKKFADENSWYRDGDWNYGLPIRYFSVVYDLIDEYPNIIYPENGNSLPSWDKKDYKKYTVDESLTEENRSWNVSEPSMVLNIKPILEIPKTDKQIIKHKDYGYGYIDKISDNGTIYAKFGDKTYLFDQDAFDKGYIVKVNESLKEELDQTETGMSSVLMDLINQEYSLLSQYESAQVTFEDKDENRFNDVFDYIKDDINIHIGMLQASIEDLSPSAEKIDDGKEQGEQLILDESLFEGNNTEMKIEEFNAKRTERMKKLGEALANMPELIDDGKAHVEVDAVTGEAIKSAEERDEQIKDSFKDKNKEVREFIRDQDKATETDKDEKEKAEDKLFLNESLFDKTAIDYLKEDIHDYISDAIHECFTVQEIMSKFPEYNADWADEEIDELLSGKIDDVAWDFVEDLFKNYTK